MFTSSTVAHPEGAPAESSRRLRRVAVNNVRQFCQECDRFIEWQYREIIAGAPSPGQLESHRHELEWALRVAKLLECVASDPDFSDRPLGNVLKAKVWQLEQSWRQIYEPISEEAANKILAEVFPDEPGA